MCIWKPRGKAIILHMPSTLVLVGYLFRHSLFIGPGHVLSARLASQQDQEIHLSLLHLYATIPELVYGFSVHVCTASTLLHRDLPSPICYISGW